MIATIADNGVAARLIHSVLDLCGPGSELIGAHEREWASASFSGARHSLDLLVPADDGDVPLPDAVRLLPDHDFALTGQIVADCSVTLGQRHRNTKGRTMIGLRVELLTILAD